MKHKRLAKHKYKLVRAESEFLQANQKENA